MYPHLSFFVATGYSNMVYIYATSISGTHVHPTTSFNTLKPTRVHFKVIPTQRSTTSSRSSRMTLYIGNLLDCSYVCTKFKLVCYSCIGVGCGVTLFGGVTVVFGVGIYKWYYDTNRKKDKIGDCCHFCSTPYSTIFQSDEPYTST